PSPDMVSVQHLARIGALDFQERWRRGDYSGATDRAIEVLGLGRRLASSRHETVIVPLVGTVISANQHGVIDREAGTLTGVPAPELQRFLSGLNRIDAYEAPVEEVTVLAERDVWLRIADQLQTKGLPEKDAAYDWAVWLIHGNLNTHSRNLYDGLAAKIAARDFEGADAMVDRLSLPFPQVMLSMLFHPGDTVSIMLLSIQSTTLGATEKLLAAEARFDALRVRLASELYRRRHGAPPPSLEALVPAYMAAVPADPFKPDRPLRYAKGRLWSVGWDGVDQQGRVATDLKALAKGRRKGKRPPGDLVLL
ncbi:MAG: hypothetical protein ACLGIN_05360, partial [Candidatus Sericytochromatia bacterium]